MFGRKTNFLSRAETPDRGYDSFDMRLGDEMRGERATLGKSLMDVQRELRIKASYIAAIENADLTAFDSLSFVAGYVRSYARYLDMDPEIVFARFCEESGFGGINALKPMESRTDRREAAIMAPKVSPEDPLLGAGNPFAKKATPVFAGFEPGALGSLAVLALLAAGLGYGGWTVVREIQRVQVAPVEEAPILQAELDPLDVATVEEETPETGAAPLAARQDSLARLYRPQALDMPILTARDAPISTIPPGALGALASAQPAAGLSGPDAVGGGGTQTASLATGGAAGSIASAVDAALAEAVGDAASDADAPQGPQVLAEAPDAVVLIAARPAWVRVRSADGDTLFEKVLEPGETYEVPAAEAPATLRTGNSGAIYFAVGGRTYGPVAPGAQVASNVALASDAVTERFALADLEDDGDLARVVAELVPQPAAAPVVVD